MREKVKTITIISLIILLLLAISIIIVLISKDNKTNNLTSITGTVLITDKDYIMLDVDGTNYLITDIKGEYKENDKIKITYDSKYLDKDKSPKEITKIEDEEIIEISKDELETNIDDPSLDNSSSIPSNNTTNNNSTNSHSTTNTNNNDIPKTNNTSSNSNKTNTNQNTNTNSTNPDTEVISYFNDLKSNFDASSVKDSVKSGFVSVIDFLFYGGTIKGHTFNELTSTAKLKVLEMALYFDSKIDKYFPGYKDTISTTTGKAYNTVKSKIVESYLTITTAICQNNSDLCNSAKQNFAKIKNTFGLTWDLIKDIAGDGLDKLKNWYEIWREK